MSSQMGRMKVPWAISLVLTEMYSLRHCLLAFRLPVRWVFTYQFCKYLSVWRYCLTTAKVGEVRISEDFGRSGTGAGAWHRRTKPGGETGRAVRRKVTLNSGRNLGLGAFTYLHVDVGIGRLTAA